MTHDELIPVYEKLQREQRYGIGETDHSRAWEIGQYLICRLTRGATVLDASCGRGYLLVYMTACGMKITGTEASRVAVEEAKHYDVRHLRYSELREAWPEQSFDAVVSNDVLEHLLSEEEALDAIEVLAGLSKTWLCFAVASHPAEWEVDGRMVPLHHVIRPVEWWRDAIDCVCDIEDDRPFLNTHFFFGRRRRSE